ncbi:MAG: 2Fe-2S iron-sulfur cluster-binding protein [Anaeromicrobium sp.]|jgi:ferredoxin|uniref:2Fe-2S iron-sulfur cluster-binding protein n=1 Tax=Anaeromicrobium sp. TaxID=1929132 RepID=UPI0025E4EDE7|nr:2Fe-2S iron-sulfur cluster-binding protein [Anaeromicrobium sp.]MCT4593604.1 2Fe-2S iron-sulfur cluster-binding protein [Anaeromicrobium sp.]
MYIKITFSKSNKIIDTIPGSTLLQILRHNNIFIPSPCGGNALCGGCRVKITKGNDLMDISAEEYDKLSDEEIKRNFRLSCSYIPKEDIIVEI